MLSQSQARLPEQPALCARAHTCMCNMRSTNMANPVVTTPFSSNAWYPSRVALLCGAMSTRLASVKCQTIHSIFHQLPHIAIHQNFTLCMLAWRIFRTQNNFAEKYVIRSIIQFIVTISNRTEQWKIATGRGLRGMCNQSPNDYISGSLHSICPMAECWYSWQQQVEMPYDLWKDTICWSYTRQ